MDPLPPDALASEPPVAQIGRRSWRAVAAVIDRSLARAVARLGSPLPLLLTLSLVQGLLGLWTVFGPASERIAPAHPLTLLGAGLYQPDHDMAVYVPGGFACVLLDALLVLLLAGRWRRAGERADPRATLAGCVAVTMLPMLSPDSRAAFLPACVIGLACLGWQLRSSPRDRPAVTVPIAPPAPVASATPRAPGLLRALLAPLAIVGLFVFVPWPEALVWRSFATDRFHHVDFYAMAPALAYAQGLRLGTDFYAQYGVGWPMVLHALGGTSSVAGYTTFMRLELLVGCAYFLGLFAFLRSWLRDAGWATAGLLLALLLALFTDTGFYAKWLWPSSTVMRYAFDIAFFWVLLAHARSGATRLGLLAGALLALQLVFSNDVGLYLLFSFAIYLTCALRGATQDRPAAATLRFAGLALLALAAVAGAGFTLANHGEVPGRAFWAGLAEPIVTYGGGIANLPIAQALGNRAGVDLLLLAMLAAYLRSLGAGLAACIERRMPPDVALRAAIGAYGLGTLLLFIGRSHEQNLMHVCIPFCLLAAHSVASTVRTLAVGAAWRGLQPQGLLSVALVAAIWVQAEKVDYPDLADAALGPVVLTRAAPAAADALPTGEPRDAAEFAAASDAIRRASDGGRHPVAVIGYTDTAYLLQAGVAPYFRYSPVLANLVFKYQVADIVRRIAESPPDWIFIAAEQERTLNKSSSVDAVGQILASLERDYVPQGKAGHFQVFRRTRQASGPPAVPRP